MVFIIYIVNLTMYDLFLILLKHKITKILVTTLDNKSHN